MEFFLFFQIFIAKKWERIRKWERNDKNEAIFHSVHCGKTLFPVIPHTPRTHTRIYFYLTPISYSNAHPCPHRSVTCHLPRYDARQEREYDVCPYGGGMGGRGRMEGSSLSGWNAVQNASGAPCNIHLERLAICMGNGVACREEAGAKLIENWELKIEKDGTESVVRGGEGIKRKATSPMVGFVAPCLFVNTFLLSHSAETQVPYCTESLSDFCRDVSSVIIWRLRHCLRWLLQPR